jgi:hypothetical protein
MRGEEVIKREVQAVKPDHGPCAFVTMVMPLPLRRKDHVSFLHVELLSFDRREAAATFDDEPQSKSPVAMRRSSLPIIDELEAAIDRVSGKWCLFRISS